MTKTKLSKFILGISICAISATVLANHITDGPSGSSPSSGSSLPNICFDQNLPLQQQLEQLENQKKSVLARMGVTTVDPIAAENERRRQEQEREIERQRQQELANEQARLERERLRLERERQAQIERQQRIAQAEQERQERLRRIAEKQKLILAGYPKSNPIILNKGKYDGVLPDPATANAICKKEIPGSLGHVSFIPWDQAGGRIGGWASADGVSLRRHTWHSGQSMESVVCYLPAQRVTYSSVNPRPPVLPLPASLYPDEETATAACFAKGKAKYISHVPYQQAGGQIGGSKSFDSVSFQPYTWNNGGMALQQITCE